MTELELNEEKTEPRKGFWRRQFQNESTAAQRTFDWIFGVVLPVICFTFDPIVFKGYGLGKGAILGDYKPLAYLLSFVSIMAMSAMLIWGAKLKWMNAFLAGLFIVGSIISFGIGVILLPFSLLGLIVFVGVLGFTPLFSSVVYIRNAVRALESSKPFFKKSVLVYSLALSAIFSFVIPYVVNAEIKRTLDEMANGDVQTIQISANRLKYVSPLVNFDRLGGKSCHSPNSETHLALAETYQQFTGESIERIDLHICEDW